MPLERKSKGFSDVSMSFQSNPFNKDILSLKNETAIARSIRNLVLTYPGERFFNSSLGCDINRSLFENYSNTLSSIITDQIKYTINRFEPRVQLISVTVEPNDDENAINATITYKIIGITVPPQQLTFALQSTR